MPVGPVLKPALIQMPGRVLIQILIIFFLPGRFRIHIDLQCIVVILQPVIDWLKKLHGRAKWQLLFKLRKRSVQKIINIKAALICLCDKIFETLLRKIGPWHHSLRKINVIIKHLKASDRILHLIRIFLSGQAD